LSAHLAIFGKCASLIIFSTSTPGVKAVELLEFLPTFRRQDFGLHSNFTPGRFILHSPLPVFRDPEFGGVPMSVYVCPIKANQLTRKLPPAPRLSSTPFLLYALDPLQRMEDSSLFPLKSSVPGFYIS